MNKVPRCFECEHVEVNPTGPMFCLARMIPTPTRGMRAEGAPCGLDGNLFEQKQGQGRVMP